MCTWSGKTCLPEVWVPLSNHKKSEARGRESWCIQLSSHPSKDDGRWVTGHKQQVTSVTPVPDWATVGNVACVMKGAPLLPSPCLLYPLPLPICPSTSPHGAYLLQHAPVSCIIGRPAQTFPSISHPQPQHTFQYICDSQCQSNMHSAGAEAQ